MKTLIHYDHIKKKVIFQYLNESSDPEDYLLNEPKTKEPDPYWHCVEGEWDLEISIKDKKHSKQV